MDWIIIGGLLIIIVTQILLRPKQLNNNKEDLEKVTKRDTTLVRPYREKL